MIFTVVMYECESWAVKKAEPPRTDAFELRCWKRLLRVPWAARKSNQSILKEPVLNIHWKDWCCRWNSNTSTTWCEELTYWKRPWCWERLKAGGEGADRGWHHQLNGHEFDSWRAAVHCVAKSRTQLSDWTELNWWLMEKFKEENSIMGEV